MPFTYERNDHERRVVITHSGGFQAPDALASIERHHAEAGAWSYAVLYDLRGLTGHPTIADLKDHVTVDVSPPDGQGAQRRGPIAILVTDPKLYALACAYGALGGAKLSVQVFQDFVEADDWLTASASQTD